MTMTTKEMAARIYGTGKTTPPTPATTPTRFESLARRMYPNMKTSAPSPTTATRPPGKTWSYCSIRGYRFQ